MLEIYIRWHLWFSFDRMRSPTGDVDHARPDPNLPPDPSSCSFPPLLVLGRGVGPAPQKDAGEHVGGADTSDRSVTGRPRDPDGREGVFGASLFCPWCSDRPAERPAAGHPTRMSPRLGLRVVEGDGRERQRAGAVTQAAVSSEDLKSAAPEAAAAPPPSPAPRRRRACLFAAASAAAGAAGRDAELAARARLRARLAAAAALPRVPGRAAPGPAPLRWPPPPARVERRRRRGPRAA
ncbi:testis-specific gene A8 protein-like [Cervus elaphus]|uniref:testis-specific gene A8 protein-like n=1 Tax=Cervus elaphus TaxID=9860 RepID=UPI001CC2BDC0|nr:testis-specific gene A8 protein-like [Cervus elaphus]